MSDPEALLAEAASLEEEAFAAAFQQRDVTELVPRLLRVLELREQALGPDSAEVAHTLHSLGSVSHDLGEVQTALEHLRRAADILRATGDDESTAAVLLKLAQVYRSQGRTSGLEELLREAVELRERVHGPDAIHTAAARRALADHLAQVGREEEAQELLRSWQDAAAAFMQPMQELFHDATSGDLSLEQEAISPAELMEMEPAVRQSVQVMERFFGGDHPHLVPALRQLAILLRRTDREPEARELEARIARISEG